MALSTVLGTSLPMVAALSTVLGTLLPIVTVLTAKYSVGYFAAYGYNDLPLSPCIQ